MTKTEDKLGITQLLTTRCFVYSDIIIDKLNLIFFSGVSGGVQVIAGSVYLYHTTRFSLHALAKSASDFYNVHPWAQVLRLFSCTCQIFKLIILDYCQIWHIVMISVVCNLYIFLKFQCKFVTLQWALRKSLNAKAWFSLRQIIRHHALKNKWIVNRIQGGMSQLVKMLEKAV